MIIDGGNGFPVRDKIIKLMDADYRESKLKGKKESKVHKTKAAKGDVLEVSVENKMASETKLKDFEDALAILEKTGKLIRSAGASVEDIHGGGLSDSVLKIVIS